MDSYTSFAQVYDMFMDNVDYPAWCEYIKSLLKEYGISERELEVIRLISEGLSNKEIAAQLYLSEGTVRNYLTTILDKLSLRDRTQLAVFYLNNRQPQA